VPNVSLMTKFVKQNCRVPRESVCHNRTNLAAPVTNCHGACIYSFMNFADQRRMWLQVWERLRDNVAKSHLAIRQASHTEVNISYVSHTLLNPSMFSPLGNCTGNPYVLALYQILRVQDWALTSFLPYEFTRKLLCFVGWKILLSARKSPHGTV
jgi:hypothetical protein